MSTKLNLLMEEVIEPYDNFDLEDEFDLEDDDSYLLEAHYIKEKMESERIFKYLLIFILSLLFFHSL